MANRFKFDRTARAAIAAFSAAAATMPALAQKTSEAQLPEVRVQAAGENAPGYIPASANTATKTDTPLQDIPQSIQVVPQKLIKDQAGYSADAAIRNVSGVTQSSSSNYGFFNNYLSRGLNVNFLRDGVPDGLTINGYARTLSDIERVEVLKGPGSALYGSGSPGGSVNLVTKKPLSATVRAFEAGLGSFGTRRALADLTGPLPKEGAAYRLIADYATSDGFRGLSNRTAEVLPSLQLKPNPDNTWLLDYDYRNVRSKTDTVGIPFHASTNPAFNSVSLVDVPRDTRLYTPFAGTTQTVNRFAIGHEYRYSADAKIRQNLVYLGRDLDLLRNAAGANFTSQTTLGSRSLRDQSDAARELIYQVEPVFKLKSGNIEHTLLTGFEYHRTAIHTQRSQSNLAPIANVFAPTIPEQSKGDLLFAPLFDRDVAANQAGLYVQDQLALTERWKARLGARWDRFKIDDNGSYNIRFDPVSIGGTNNPFTGALAANGQSFIPNAPILQRQTAGRSDNKTTANAGLVYQPVEQTSFYAGIATGAQATVSTESSRTAFAPETSRQIELGNKSSLLDGKLNLNAALFEVARNDFLQTINGVPTPIGEQMTRGLEIDVSAQPARGWFWLANYARQAATYTKLKTAAGLDDPNVGKTVVGVPRNSAALWTTYEFQDPAWRGWGVGAGLTYRAGVFLDQPNIQVLPGYTLTDAMIFYRQRAYEVQLNLTNLADTKWYRNGVNTAGLPGDPRSVFATLRLKF